MRHYCQKIILAISSPRERRLLLQVLQGWKDGCEN